MRTLTEINNEIEKVKNELENVRGREAEVYTRIVGYYRSVRNWNKGKRDEYDKRKLFVPNSAKIDKVISNLPKNTHCDSVECKITCRESEVAKLELYTKGTCPNCPPIIDFCKNLDVRIVNIDVETEAGFRQAKKNEVMSAPTVIFYNSEGEELNRAYSVSELEKIFLPDLKAV